MLRLRAALLLSATLAVLGCREGAPQREETQAKAPETLPELLEAHDAEVRQHGTDLYYTEKIGRFGKEGVVAALDHIEKGSRHIASNNNIRLLLDAGIEAKRATGYDFCADKEVMSRIERMNLSGNVPDWSRRTFAEGLYAFCEARKSAAH